MHKNFLIYAQVLKVQESEGQFKVIREGEILLAEKEGEFLLEDLDIIFSLNKPLYLSFNQITGIQAQIEVSPRTVILIEASPLKEEQEAKLIILKGELRISNISLSPNSYLTLLTDSLKVDLPPKADLVFLTFSPLENLIVPYNQKVPVYLSKDLKEKNRHLLTRGLVGDVSSGDLRSYLISPLTLLGYSKAWLSLKEQLIQEDKYIDLIKRLLQKQSSFAKTFGRLESFSTIVQKWKEQDLKGILGNKDEVEEELLAFRGSLSLLYNQIPFLLESLEFLESWRKFSQKFFSIKVSSDLSLEKFLKGFSSFSESLRRDIYECLWIVKLYKKRNNGLIEESLWV